jgi:hypothetical protein
MCNTCSHTMQALFVDSEASVRIFWCPRCGTVKRVWSDCETEKVPRLVDYVRKDNQLAMREATYSEEQRGAGVVPRVPAPPAAME